MLGEGKVELAMYKFAGFLANRLVTTTTSIGEPTSIPTTIDTSIK